MEKLGFWSAPGKSQSYLNMLYLLISYPLGLLYFIFIVVGLALGFGLFITWLGIPILVGVMFIWLGFAYFERGLTKIFLNMEVPYSPQLIPKNPTIWSNLKSRFTNSYTWKSFGYLMLRFPLGIIGFVVLVTLISVTISFIATPFVFYFLESGLIPGEICTAGAWCWVASYPIAILVGLIGILMIFVSMAIFNGLSRSYGLLARSMLSNRTTASRTISPKNVEKSFRKKTVKRSKAKSLTSSSKSRIRKKPIKRKKK